MIFVFGKCALDIDRRELRRAGVVRPLEPKAFTVLVHLLTHRGRAVPKQELLEVCWPGEFVTEAALTRCLKVIRQAVGDDGVQQHLIKTLRGHGYRFIAAVETPPTLPTAPSPSDAAAAVASVHPVAGPTIPTPGQPCLQCQTVNRATRQFCAACGQALWLPCPQCGFGNDPTERFCGGCGRDVAAPVSVPPGARMGPPQAYTPAHLAQRLRTTPLPPPGERKQGTILGGEIEGLRTLRQVADSEVVDDVLNRGFALLVAEVHRVEGFISQVAGHGFTALFGVPLACEDHVLRALHAALGIRRAFTGYAAELQQTLGVSLGLRLGVHTGPLIVSAISTELQLAYTAPGATLEVATGLQQLAPVGTIAVSAAVHEAAAGFFRLTALGQYLLPESMAAVPVYACDGVGPVTSRFAGALARGRTTLQGRTRELAFLEDCWARVCRGAGQVVCLVGEAGVGKSRLAYECQQRLADARWLTLQALSYGQAMPYHAFLPLLRTVLGVQETADPAQQQQAIQTRLAALEPTLAAAVPFLAHLLGLPLAPEGRSALAPEEQRRWLQQACLQVLLQQAADAPLGLLVEDGHWLDPSSQELLDLLVAALARRRLFVLCTARPGFRHLWTDYRYCHQMAIEPLAAEETEALLQDLLQPYGAAPALQAWLYARTGGNPFFVEELVRVLQAPGLLTVQAGVYAMAASPVTLPASIQDIVQTRLDRLPDEEKHLLQMAAVIGSEVPLPLLQTCVGSAEAALHRGLTHLQALEFLYETRPGPVRTYTFKHTLVQEAVYQSLLKSTQQQHHAQIAQVLATQCPDIAATQPELLAQHYTAAGLGVQALPYWQRAGERAVQRSAHVEAIEHLTAGLGILMTLPDTPGRARQELVLRIALGASLLMSKGPTAPEVEETYARARTLCQQVEDSLQLSRVLSVLAGIYINRAEHQASRALAEQLLDLAQRMQHPISLFMAHQALGSVLGWLGEFVRAKEHLDEARALNTPQLRASHSVTVARVANHCYAAGMLWVLGYPEQALQRSHEALTLAHALSHPYSLGFALHYAGWVHWWRREPPQIIERAEAEIALATQYGFALWRAGGTVLRGCALAQQGRTAEGIGQIRQGIAAWRATRSDVAMPLFFFPLAEAYGEEGRIAKAHHLLRKALAAVENRSERFWEAELHRLKGELHLRQTIPQEHPAEACFQQALTVARRQHAKALELRAAMSLARLWQRQGKRAEAYALLAPISGWFTEGCDTADRQEAKALLDELV